MEVLSVCDGAAEEDQGGLWRGLGIYGPLFTQTKKYDKFARGGHLSVKGGIRLVQKFT